MAGQQVEIVASQIDKQRLGYMGLSLTNYDADTEPQIAAGSKVEIGGALFEFTALESITGWAGIGNNNDVYIKLAVSGTSVTAAFTTAAPTWSTSKQGWYSGLDHYVAKLRKDGSGNYTLKRLLRHPQHEAIATRELDDLGVTTTKLADGAVQSAKLGRVFGSGGVQSIAEGANWVPPAGVYMMAKEGASTTLRLQVFQGAAWRGTVAPWTGGLVMSDGTNVRLFNFGTTGAATIYYLEMV